MLGLDDPEADLDTVWWDCVERYQLLQRPAGRRATDWAAKIHVALVPVYYHNYELGQLLASQLRRRLNRDAGGIVGRPEAGRWLIDRVLLPRIGTTLTGLMVMNTFPTED
mgnify:CR=1 FL=1